MAFGYLVDSIMKCFVCSILCFLITNTFAFAEDGSYEEAMRALEENTATFIEAYNDGDADRIAALFLEQGELILTNGEIVSGL